MDWLGDEEMAIANAMSEGPRNWFEVDVRSFLEKGVGLSCSCQRGPKGSMEAQEREGEVDAEEGDLSYVKEAPVAHALRIVYRYLASGCGGAATHAGLAQLVQ